MSDLCCYWFEKARARSRPAGLRGRVAGHDGIRQVGATAGPGRIEASGRIFFAVSDRDWVLDGAGGPYLHGRVRAREVPARRILDGRRSAGHPRRSEVRGRPDGPASPGGNVGRCFMGDHQVRAFDIERPRPSSSCRPEPSRPPQQRRPAALFRTGSDLVRSQLPIAGSSTSVSACPRKIPPASRGPFEYLVEACETPRHQECPEEFGHGDGGCSVRPLPAFRRAVRDQPRYIGRQGGQHRSSSGSTRRSCPTQDHRDRSG